MQTYANAIRCPRCILSPIVPNTEPEPVSLRCWWYQCQFTIPHKKLCLSQPSSSSDLPSFLFFRLWRWTLWTVNDAVNEHHHLTLAAVRWSRWPCCQKSRCDFLLIQGFAMTLFRDRSVVITRLLPMFLAKPWVGSFAFSFQQRQQWKNTPHGTIKRILWHPITHTI